MNIDVQVDRNVYVVNRLQGQMQECQVNAVGQYVETVRVKQSKHVQKSVTYLPFDKANSACILAEFS
jgi:hypothetical protein